MVWRYYDLWLLISPWLRWTEIFSVPCWRTRFKTSVVIFLWLSSYSSLLTLGTAVGWSLFPWKAKLSNFLLLWQIKIDNRIFWSASYILFPWLLLHSWLSKGFIHLTNIWSSYLWLCLSCKWIFKVYHINIHVYLSVVNIWCQSWSLIKSLVSFHMRKISGVNLRRLSMIKQ